MARLGRKAKTKSEPPNVVWGYLGRVAEGRATPADARIDLAGVSFGEILDALGNLAAALQSSLGDEKRDAICHELAAADGTPEVKHAVVAIGEPLLTLANAEASMAAFEQEQLVLHEPGDMMRVALELIFAMSRAAPKIGMTFNWA